MRDGKKCLMCRWFMIPFFLVLLSSTSFATGPIIDAVNNLDSIGQTDTDPPGNTVNDLITGHITVPNNDSILDDFEDTTYDQHHWGGFWYTADDTGLGQATHSVIDSFSGNIIIDGEGYNNTKGVKINYTLGDSIPDVPYKYAPFVEIGVTIKEVPDVPQSIRDSIRDLTFVDSIKYWFKGPAHEFIVETKDIADKGKYEYYRQSIDASVVWKMVAIDFDSSSVFDQPSWKTEAMSLSKDSVIAFTWNISGREDTSGTIWLDDFQVKADFPDPGIAVVGINNDGVGGNWQYKTNGSWTNFLSTNSDSTARLLNNTSMVRFKPDDSNNGIPTITLRAWDQSESRPNGSIANTKRADSTDQTVFSEVPQTATIIVGGPPEVIINPRDTTVKEDSTAAFSITATGTEPLTYQWKKLIGATWIDEPGPEAQVPTYIFTAVFSDNRKAYRCVVSNVYGTDTSRFATLYVLPADSAPHFTDPPMNDTIIAEGDDLSFGTAVALGNPTPTYEWFYRANLTSVPVSVETGADFLITGAQQSDEGYYFIVATNTLGSAVSDTAHLKAYADPNITKDLPTTNSLLQNTSASLTIIATGDGTLNYQWYKNSQAISGADDDSLFLSTVTIASHNDSTYSCNVWSSTAFADTMGNVVSSTVCTLKVGKYSNPFELVAKRVDEHNTTQVILTISSNQDLTSFPNGPFDIPRADSVWVLYQTKDYPADTTDVVEIVWYRIENIKQAAGNTITDTLNVQPFPVDNDLHYYFTNTVYWYDTPSDTLLPLVNWNRVFLGDTVSPENNLTIAGEYIAGTDSAKITVGNTSSLSDSWDSVVVFECIDSVNFLSDTALPVSVLKSGNTYVFNIKVEDAPFDQRTVYCRCQVVGKNAATSEYQTASFIAGRVRPVYQGVLVAEATAMSDAVKVSWDMPDPGTDSIRIWFDTDSIPIGEYSIPLPPENAFYAQKTVTEDTIMNLNSSTLYYFSLQIFNNGMWSRTTDLASDTATTTEPDTALKVPNAITITNGWFDTITNAIHVEWTVDTSVTPEGATLQWGYTYSVYPDESFKTGSPSWDSVASTGGAFSFPLGMDIVFDTTYTVGMWLRAKTKTSVGPSSGPGDSVAYAVAVSSFTWQVIVFHQGQIDTVYAANQKITLQAMDAFQFTDTLWAFKWSTLPNGFVDVGAVPFFFDTKKPQIPHIILGMKYRTLPDGITEDDIGLYRYIDGGLHVVHEFYIEDSTVWDTLANTDMEYPYLVLADTVKPVITVSLTNYSDTVSPVSSIPTWFDVQDNIYNVHWQFLHGSGHEGYVYSEDVYMTSTLDSFNVVIKDSAVNKSFGARAIIVASDGVHADTANISRCVRNSKTEVFSVTEHKWAPLRTTAGLEEPELDIIFGRSVDEAEPWEYDIYQYRLYRWYNSELDEENEWLEYSDEVKEEFSFVPGRLIWCKTEKDQMINFGAGVTPTLKEPYEIELKPQNWTDFTLPFQFSIMLRDILETTGISASDSLDIYHWVQTELVYEPTFVYISSIDTLTTITDSVIISTPQHDGYTVYNYSLSPITLRIPPISLPLSKYSASQKRQTEVNRDSWVIHFTWAQDKKGDEPFYKRVRCGYKNNGQNGIQYGLLPPTMSKVLVGILDSSRNRVCGWALQSSLGKGGMAFDMRLNNYSGKKAKIKYYLDDLHVLPKGYNAKVLNPQTHKYEECTGDDQSDITVDSDMSASRLLVIGTQKYLAHILAQFLPMKLLKAYPNPFNGRIRIHYRLPMNIKEITFTLYNIQGRTLWSGVDRRNITAGEHVFYFNGKTGSGNILSAGVYIVRMTAKNKAGKVVLGGEKKVTCIK